MSYIIAIASAVGLYLIFKSFKSNKNEVYDASDRFLKKKEDDINKSMSALKPDIKDNRSDKEVEDYYNDKGDK